VLHRQLFQQLQEHDWWWDDGIFTPDGFGSETSMQLKPLGRVELVVLGKLLRCWRLKVVAKEGVIGRSKQDQFFFPFVEGTL
jgi:hypothetical protein